MNQYHPDVIAKREKEAAEAAAKKAAEDKVRIEQINAIMAKNRILAFNCGKSRHPSYPEIREPNPLQKQLLDAWRNPQLKVFTYMGANRIGKCLTYQTLVETPNGEISVGELFERGEPFEVYSWNGQERVAALAMPPFKKEGLHQCYRITMTDGRIIEAADHHLILTTKGYVSVDTLYAESLVSVQESFSSVGCTQASQNSSSSCCLSSPFLQESSLEPCLSGQPQDVLCLSQTPSDCQDGCSTDYRLYGGQPLSGQAGVQVFAPSQADVQPCSCHESGSGGHTSTHTCIPSCTLPRLSSQYEAPHSEGQCAESLAHASCNTSQPCSCLSQEVQPFSSELASPPQSCAVFSTQSLQQSDLPDNTTCYPFHTPLYVYSNKIECITPIDTSQECYDFEVPVYKNYFAGGLIHHNTTIGAILAISTLRGEWPWSGEKIPFPHTNPRRIAYVGQGWETHIIPALKFWWPEDMPVKPKKNNQGVDATWEFWSRSHDKGMQGELQIFSTSQDVTVFEGAQYDLVIYDEPPPRDIRVACARGLVDRKGRELFCCTLLNQAWIHRDIIRATNEKGEPDPTYFNLSGDSSVNIGYGITQEGIDQFAKSLTQDQVRILGKPSYLSALVCPRFDRKTHIKERFQIPLNALIDISIDWHPSKPLMVVFMATLSNGMKYVCDEIKFRGNIKAATEEIVRVIRMRDYARINKVIIDPLSKSGQPNDSDAFSVMEEILMPYGYALEVASKEKENGIELLNNLLWTQNECPAIFFFRDCVNAIQEVEDMMYDENGKPVKVNDDAFECIYRLALLNTEWFEEWKSKVSGSHRSVVL